MELGTLIADRYLLLALVGQGATGAVYRARDTALERLVAIKILHAELTADPEARRRFVREARVTGQLVHPAAVCVLDWGIGATVSRDVSAEQRAASPREPDARPYLVMEWLEGESLRDRLARPLPLAHGVHLVEQIASVLAAAHALGLVHRDIKPENVLVIEGEPPVARVVDFGLARMLGEGAEERGLGRVTAAGQALATLAYAAPELHAGGEPGGAADVYALGCVLHEVLVGAPPFIGSVAEVQNGHLYVPVPQLRGHHPALPAMLDELVLQMLQKDPAARPSAAEVGARLAASRLAAESPPRESAAPRAERALSKTSPPPASLPQLAAVGGTARGSSTGVAPGSSAAGALAGSSVGSAAGSSVGSSAGMPGAAPAATTAPRIGVSGGDPALRQALTQAGFVVVTPEEPELNAVLVLGTNEPALEAALARGVPVVCEAAALDFDAVAALLRRGVREVVPSPAQLDDVLRRLGRATRRRSATSR